MPQTKARPITKALASLFVLFVSGCTAAPKLADYPRREIDRPHSLPEGLATWSTAGYLFGVQINHRWRNHHRQGHLCRKPVHMAHEPL